MHAEFRPKKPDKQYVTNLNIVRTKRASSLDRGAIHSGVPGKSAGDALGVDILCLIGDKPTKATTQFEFQYLIYLNFNNRIRIKRFLLSLIRENDFGFNVEYIFQKIGLGSWVCTVFSSRPRPFIFFFQVNLNQDKSL